MTVRTEIIIAKCIAFLVYLITTPITFIAGGVRGIIETWKMFIEIDEQELRSVVENCDVTELVKEETEQSIMQTGIKCLTKEEALRACDIIAWASKQGYLGQTEAKDLCSKITYNNKGWL